MAMNEGLFQKKLRDLGGTNTKGFSVPYQLREEMDIEEGDMLQIKIEKIEGGDEDEK